MMFGILMFALDFPVPNEKVKMVRTHIYTFVLFMTRFVGRGVWYMFLGTMVFASLWDNGISPLLGFFLGGYIIILGGVTTFRGFQISRKLESLRIALKMKPPAR